MAIPVAPPEPLPTYTLTDADRCDKRGCSSRAYIRVTVTLGLSDLLFCGHHGHECRAEMIDVVHDWVDETRAILA